MQLFRRNFEFQLLLLSFLMIFCSTHLPNKILLSLYYSLVYPYLSYGNLVWASNYKTKLKRLLILQKRIVRVLARAPFNSHTSALFQDLGILKIEQINIYQVGEFMHRYTHNQLPNAFCNYFKYISDQHSHYTRNKGNKYLVDFSRTNIRKFSLVIWGPRLWNSLSPSLRHIPHLTACLKGNSGNIFCMMDLNSCMFDVQILPWSSDLLIFLPYSICVSSSYFLFMFFVFVSFS